MNSEHILQTILELIERADGDSDWFAETLRDERIPHLSFSQISCVEACRRRYYLQYILGQELQPVPDYFIKGKLFHHLLATHYRENDYSTGQASREHAQGVIASGYSGLVQRHLENAYLVHLQNCWTGCEVVAVEKPFAMLVDPDLPPLVGVIDLVVRRNGTYITVDHKTGRDFYPQDELQSAIYLEYIRREFGGNGSAFYYDHYRWVNNLERIRKPALQRTRVDWQPGDWLAALERIRRGYRLIQQIREHHDGWSGGECFRCPYRQTCREY